jgi:FtsH-binding integral membrane protein
MHIENDNSLEINNNKQPDYGTYYKEEADRKNEIESEMRRGFIRKVYTLLSCCLLFTLFVCLLSVHNESYRTFQQQDIIVFIIAVVISITILVVLFCFTENMKKVPINYILLGAFTLCQAYIVSHLCSTTDPQIVFCGMTMTVVMTITLSVYAYYAKTDFTLMSGLMFCLAITMLLFTICAIIIQSKIFYLFLAALGVFVFSIYIIYDTQLILGRHKVRLSCDDYILGVLMLYIDVIALFTDLLALLNCLS